MPSAINAGVVLLVEDDTATRELYRSALTRVGYVVTAVDDGLPALRSIERERPDVIVLDLALPRLGGRDVLREVRTNPATRNVPIIIVTGTDVNDLRLRERAVAPLLQKPIDPAALIRAVEDAIPPGRMASPI